MTRKKNEIINIVEMNEEKDVVQRHLGLFHELVEQFKELQVAVQSLLNAEEKESLV